MKRKMIKWIAFDSVINSKKVVADLSNKKMNKPMPILSNEQFEEIEYNLLKAFSTKAKIKIIYYQDNKWLEITSHIKHIDNIKKIIITDNFSLYFHQIISIKLV